MALLIRSADVPVQRMVRTGNTGAGEMEVRLVHGKECDILIGLRKPGYHSRPHAHDCEQLNYVAEGEVWMFVEDKAYLCKAGDFHRVPRNKVHWAWNRADKPVLLFEAHSPPLLPSEVDKEMLVGLFDDGEPPQVSQATDNRFVEYDYKAVEVKYFGREG